MTEVVWPSSADGADEQLVDGNVPNMRHVLPAPQFERLAREIVEVLRSAAALDMDEPTRAALVATWIAPQLAEQAADLADARVQLGQAGAALAESMAAAIEWTTHTAWVAQLAHDRAVVAHRLRLLLWESMADAERFRTLTEQRCPVGLHDGWFAPSGGKQHSCPWCLIAERTEDVERLRAHVAECHRLQNNIAAVVGVETDWDAPGRKAVLDAVCRMSGNLDDARRAAESTSDGES